MTAPPVLVGVDVVEVDRISRAVAYSGPAYARHVTAPDEPPLHPDPDLATAAGVAVKESLVKALGGRPAGFSWHDFAAGLAVPDPVRDLLDGAVPELAATADIALDRFCGYTVRGASAEAARARFAGGAVGAARWGWRGNLVVAVAILTTLPEGAR
ncbi:phosphopantetheinyl transferase [Actinokineospora soli]|uniref:Phosphopantetheinyl transferase n=1 Tax=Actinokineospora soli TaxID=1048753 RepID=A0ABW2THJ3_9PSEU